MKNDRDDSTSRRGAGCGKLSLRGCLIGLATIAVLATIGWYVLMGQAAAPINSSFCTIDPPKIRQLAMESPGELPLRLNAVVVGEGSCPQGLVMAGSGLTPRRRIFAAYQLVYDDQSVVIDSTLPEADYEKMFPGSPFDTEGYDNIQQALRKSSLILLTHTHVVEVVAGQAPIPVGTPEAAGPQDSPIGLFRTFRIGSREWIRPIPSSSTENAVTAMQNARPLIEQQRQLLNQQYARDIQSPKRNSMGNAVTGMIGRGTLGSSMSGDWMRQFSNQMNQGMAQQQNASNQWAANQNLGMLDKQLGASQSYAAMLMDLLGLSRITKQSQYSLNDLPGDLHSTNPNP